ncbi:MAG: 1-acyl-sn-glycerol-3-phosphate acyltransferase [Treponema sp.]|nr:1-acyl-sn-glycerol-3-phosphate acyltransferase [Treponema sp.]
MFSLISIICLVGIVAFPTLMLTICYPFSHKAALFWSDYITGKCARQVFAVLGLYSKFNLAQDKKSKDGLPEQFLILSNHQSLFDIVVYLVFFSDKKVRFVAKDSLSKVPMVGKMLKSQGHCMIPRKGSPMQAMDTLKKFGDRVKRDSQILPLIFPEGTRSKDGRLGKFYAAGFRMVENTVKLPVVVCALDGGWRLANILRIVSNLSKGIYRVKVLKVYDSPKGKEEEKNILSEASELINRQLKEWRG